MAIINSTLFGKCRGKTYIRTKGEKSEKPKSVLQVQQQNRLAAVAMFYRAIRDAGLYGIWQLAAKQRLMHGYNLFVQHNIHVFSDEGLIRDFMKIHLSVGELELPDDMTIRQEAEGEWILEWKCVLPRRSLASGDDRLAVALMSHESVYTVKVPDIGDFRREDCRAVIRLPADLQNYTHLYCYFCSATGKGFSMSRYFLIHNT